MKSNSMIEIQKIKIKGKFSMKPFFLTLFFAFFLCAIQAKTYYISNSTGNDSYSATQAQNQLSPWKSIAKLNSMMGSLVSGDQVLFQSGDVFYGTLTTSASGVTYGAYGSGAKPVITGLSTISGWTSLGGNIWEASVPNGLSTLNTVVLNGKLTPMGRYPNITAANGGYLTYESAVTNVSLTDNQLSATPNWTGAEVYFRREDYASDRAKITNHSGTKITFSTYNGAAMKPGYGYFIQNSPSTLDQNGEWFYNPTTKKISMYYTSTPPSIQVSTLSNLVYLVNPNTSIKSNITFRGISFKGCEGIMMQLTYCNNLTVDNCEFTFAGTNAIEYRYVTYLTIQNSTIQDVNMMGIHEFNTTLNNNITIQNNSIRRIGINAGMISNAYGEGVSSTAINVVSTNLLIKENILDSIGYMGIALKVNKNNQIVRKNVISNFCMVKNDGGAIYNSGLRGGSVVSNIVIDSNIIFKPFGATAGTLDMYDKHTRSIYLDATTYGVKVLNNTIFDAWDGIYLSQAQNNIISGNTIYNTGTYKTGTVKYSSSALVLSDQFEGYPHTRNNTITNNIFFGKNPDQLLYYQTDRYDGVGSVGVIDNNYFANPTSEIPLFMTNTTAASTITLYSLVGWKAAYPNYNQNSKGSPRKIPQFTYNLIGANKSPNESLLSNITGIVASSSPLVHTLSWDNTSQITGTGSIKLTSSVTSTAFTNLYQIIGAVDASKKYLLRFKTKSTKPGMFKTYLQQWTGAYSIMTTAQIGSIGTGIEQHEIVFSGEHTSQSSAAVFIQFPQTSSTIYIDDIQFFEANVSPVNVDDYHRFDYNATKSPITIPLSYNYIGLDGTIYNKGSLTLQPFTSRILLRDTGSIVAPPTAPVPPAGSTLIAKASAGSLNCSGTSVPVTVTATGGTQPYSGTGTFNTNGGKGSLKISFPSSNSTVNTTLYASVGAVTAGKTYVLKYSTLSTVNNLKLSSILRKSSAPSTILSGSQTATFGTSKTDHKFTFTPSSSDANARFDIDIPQNSGTVYIDNVAFFETDSKGALIGNNLFSTGDFETGITGLIIWSSNNNHVSEWDVTGKINNTNYYTVTDANGNKSTAEIVISQPSVPLSASAKANGNITVTGGSTTITVSATGGFEPYQGTGTFTVTAGNYNITVTDANGCTATAPITITQPASGTGSTPVAKASAGVASCTASTIPVTVTASGGTAPYTGTGTFNTNAGTGSLKISFPSSVSNTNTVLYASVGAITGGKTYVLKYSTLGSNNSGTTGAVLRKSSTPSSILGAYQSTSFGTSKTDHKFTFTAASSDANGRFDIDISQNSGTVYLDNVAFFETNSAGALIGSNMVPAGQFETGITGLVIWSSNNNQTAAWDATGKINNTNYYTVTDANGNKSTAEIVISQPAVPLSAVAKANGSITSTGGTTTVTVSATGGVAPYKGTGTFTVTAGYYNISVTDANGCVTAAPITITQSAARSGSSSGISLNTSPSLNNVEMSNSFKISSYPNPSNDEFNLVIQGGTNERVDIVVAAADGRLMLQKSGSSNKTYKFGGNFKPGLYIIKVIQGNNTAILKVIKA